MKGAQVLSWTTSLAAITHLSASVQGVIGGAGMPKTVNGRTAAAPGANTRGVAAKTAARFGTTIFPAACVSSAGALDRLPAFTHPPGRRGRRFTLPIWSEKGRAINAALDKDYGSDARC